MDPAVNAAGDEDDFPAGTVVHVVDAERAGKFPRNAQRPERTRLGELPEWMILMGLIGIHNSNNNAPSRLPLPSPPAW